MKPAAAMYACVSFHPSRFAGRVSRQGRVRVRRVRTEKRLGKLERLPPHPAFGHLLPRGEKGKSRGDWAGKPKNARRPSPASRERVPRQGRERARRLRTEERPGRLGRRSPQPAFGHLLPQGEKVKKPGEAGIGLSCGIRRLPCQGKAGKRFLPYPAVSCDGPGPRSGRARVKHRTMG